MEATVLFVNATKIHQFKVRNSETKKASLFFSKIFRKCFCEKDEKNSVRWVCVQFFC